MPHATITDREFANAWREAGGEATAVAKMLGMSVRGIYRKRNAVEAAIGVQLPSAGNGNGYHRGDAGVEPNDYLQKLTIDGITGTVIVSSDHHYWPNQPPSLAHRALVEVTKELKPKVSILNGDVFDGARLSRFPRNGWEYQPKVRDELEEAKERVAEIRHAYRGAQTFRTIGNHCIRFDRYLATNAGEMEQVAGARLADHLNAWKECVSIFINGHTMIKHRFHGGIHAAYNNTLRAGTNIVTGHTHHLEVRPWADYRGRRYGVQTGAIADIDGPQFSYTENNPTPWCSGFAVLTFDKSGRLLMPEICEVIEGAAYFRGQIVVSDRKKKAA
jgi:hypothetical protein